MNYILLISLFLHSGPGSWFNKTSYPEVDLMQVRLAPWQINMQRIIYYTDTCYALQFRDQSTMNSVAIKTMDLETMQQLKYFREGLLTLKKGNTGTLQNSGIIRSKKLEQKKKIPGIF